MRIKRIILTLGKFLSWFIECYFLKVAKYNTHPFPSHSRSQACEGGLSLGNV